MKNIPEPVVQKFTSASRKIFWLGRGLSFVLSGLLSCAILNIEEKWSWIIDRRWLIEGIGFGSSGILVISPRILGCERAYARSHPKMRPSSRQISESLHFSLLVFSFLCLVVSLITAGLLFIFLYPELGAAWIQGINPIAYKKPWAKLSGGVKVYVFFHAMVFLAAGIMVAYQVIINTWYK